MNPNVLPGGELANNNERSREQLRLTGDKSLESTKAALIKDVQLGLAQLESMGRRTFKDETAKAKNDAQMEREYAKLQELVARNDLGIALPPLKLSAPISTEAKPAPETTPKIEAPASTAAPEVETNANVTPRLDAAMVTQMMGGAAQTAHAENNYQAVQDALADGDGGAEYQSAVQDMLEASQADMAETPANPGQAAAESPAVVETPVPTPETSAPAPETPASVAAAEAEQEQPNKEQDLSSSEADAAARREASLQMEAEANLKAAREEGYKQAQLELAQILNGRSIEQAVNDFEADVNHLNEEIELMQQRVYLDPQSQAEHLRRINEAKADLASMQRRQNMVKNLQTGEGPVEMAEGAPVRFDVQAANGTLDDNNPLVEANASALAAEETTEPVAEANTEGVAEQKPESAALDDLIRQAYAETLTEVEAQGNWDERIAELSTEMEKVRDYITTNEANIAALTVKMNQLAEGDPGRATYEAQILVSKKGVKAYQDRYKILEAKRAAAQKVAEQHQDDGELNEAENTDLETLKRGIFERLKAKPAFKNFAKKAAAVALAALVGFGILSGTAGEAKAAGDFDNDPSKQTSEAAIDKTNLDELYAQLGVEVGTPIDETLIEDSGLTIDDLSELDANYEVAENGVFYNYDEYNGYGDRSNKHSYNAFGMDKSYLYENQDVEETANAIYKIAHEQPEVLATFVSNYPTLLAECGLDENLTANEIDNLISNSEGGGQLQKKLLEAFERLLESDNTSFEFSLATSRVQTPYMVLNKGNNPAGHILAMDERTRADEPQVKVTYTIQDKDGNPITYAMYLNLQCGFQPNIFQESPITTPAGKPEVVVKQTPNVPETAPNEEHPPIMVVDLTTPTPGETPTTPEDPKTPINPETPETPEDPEKPTPPKPGEDIKKKNAQSIIDAGSLGLGENNKIDQTKNFEEMTAEEIGKVGDGQVNPGDITGNLAGVYQETSEVAPTDDNAGKKVEQAVTDSSLSEDEQKQLQQEIASTEAAANAMEQTGTRPETEDEINDYYQSILDDLANGDGGSEYQNAVNDMLEASQAQNDNAETTVDAGEGTATVDNSGLTPEP